MSHILHTYEPSCITLYNIPAKNPSQKHSFVQEWGQNRTFHDETWNKTMSPDVGSTTHESLLDVFLGRRAVSATAFSRAADCLGSDPLVLSGDPGDESRPQTQQVWQRGNLIPTGMVLETLNFEAQKF